MPSFIRAYGLMRQRLDEEDVLNGDIEALISPYLTANLWVSRFVPFDLHYKQR